MSTGNAMTTPTQAFEWSGKAHACSAKEMTVTSILLIAQACFFFFEWSITKIDRVVFRFWGYSNGIWERSRGVVRTRSRIVAKPYQFLYERPFPDDWKSPDTSRKADAVSANLFAVLRQDPPPFDLSFWSFLTFLNHGIEKIERHLL